MSKNDEPQKAAKEHDDGRIRVAMLRFQLEPGRGIVVTRPTESLDTVTARREGQAGYDLWWIARPAAGLPPHFLLENYGGNGGKEMIGRVRVLPVVVMAFKLEGD